MDSEIFASERNHHQRFRLIYRILLGVLLLAMAVVDIGRFYFKLKG